MAIKISNILNLVMPDMRENVVPHPVLALLLEPLLEPMDLLLQHVDPLAELRRCQLLLLVIAGAEGGTAPTAGGTRHHISKPSLLS